MLRNLFIIFLISVQFNSSAQLTQRFDSLFNTYHKSGLFEGTALIADSSGIVYHKAFGIANQEHGTLNDSSTIFRLGSLEKQFTAMLILQLIEKGTLNLKGKISDYLPGYKKEISSKVTIEHLLTHTSGIPNYTALPNVWNDSFQLAYQPEYILHNFCSGDLEFTPGSKYKYNNTGYFILAQIIERVTGKPLSVVLQENVLAPAGMVNTGLEDHSKTVKNKALGYYRLADTYINEPYIHVPNTLGAASIYSTAYDLYLWDRILYSNELLRDANLKLYLSPQFTVEPDYKYGFGWEFTQTRLADNETLGVMEHSGAIRAFRALVFRITSEKKCIIVLSNCASQSGYDLFESIMLVFRGENWKRPGKLLADTLYRVLQSTSAANAILTYKRLKKQDTIDYDFTSSSLELFGERLLLLRNYDAAVAVFQLAVEENPKYTYGYYHLGKAFEKSGKIKEALKAYQAAVTNDKNSRPAKDAAFQINYLKGKK